MLVQPLHPIGYPTRAGLQKHHFQLRIPFENTAPDDAHDANHLFEGVRRGVNEKRIVESLRCGSRTARADMHANRHAELLGLRIEWIKIGLIEIPSGRVSSDGDADKPQ